jgi:hypothetical protein
VSSWNLLITILCIIMVILLLIREYRRNDKRRFILRWFASVLTIVGLWGMGLRFKKNLVQDAGSPSRLLNDSLLRKQNAFTDIHWPFELKSGQPLILQGRYKNSNEFPVTIRLNEFNKTLDSIRVGSGETQNFTFSTIPRQKGKSLFQLQAGDRNKILETEPIPLVIHPADSLNLMILSSYPDFENKFLDQWLASNHIGVAQRTRISRDRFEKYFINRQPVEFNRISEEMLRPFDLLICDPSAFSSLSVAEQNSIRHQVNENGMGLMIRTDTVHDNKSFYNELFPTYRFQTKTSQQRMLYTTDSAAGIPYPGNQELTGIRQKPGNQSLVFDREAHILVSSRLEGMGKIIFSTLNRTYNWSLAGNTEAYGSFWTYLIHQSARKKPDQLKLWLMEKFPRKNEPVHFKIQYAGEHLPLTTVNRDPFYLIQDKNLSNQWEGVYWPKQTGWQPAVHLSDRYFEWYVYEANDWPEFIRMPEQELHAEREEERYNNIFYFLLFFMSGWSFLWVERKLSLI